MTQHSRTAIRLLVALVLSAGLQNAARAGDFEDGQAAYNNRDYATALHLWKPLAEQGNAKAQYNIGLMYYFGDGVPQDYSEAIGWFLPAAKQGDIDAQSTLGTMYQIGTGVPQDPEQAQMWLNLAAEQRMRIENERVQNRTTTSHRD